MNNGAMTTWRQVFVPKFSFLLGKYLKQIVGSCGKCVFNIKDTAVLFYEVYHFSFPLRVLHIFIII